MPEKEQGRKRSYNSVSTGVMNRTWRDLSERGRLVYLTINVTRHRKSEGLFEWPVPYIAADVGLEHDQVDEALDELGRAGFIVYDDDVGVILDRRALHDYEPRGPKQIGGAVRKVRDIPHTPLKALLIQLAQVHAPDFAEALIEAFPEAVADRVPEQYRYGGARARQLEGELESELEPHPLEPSRSENGTLTHA